MQNMVTIMSANFQAVADHFQKLDDSRSMKRSTGRQGGTNVASKDATSHTVKFKGCKFTRRHILDNATLSAHSQVAAVRSMRKAS